MPPKQRVKKKKIFPACIRLVKVNNRNTRTVVKYVQS